MDIPVTADTSCQGEMLVSWTAMQSVVSDSDSKTLFSHDNLMMIFRTWCLNIIFVLEQPLRRVERTPEVMNPT